MLLDWNEFQSKSIFGFKEKKNQKENVKLRRLLWNKKQNSVRVPKIIPSICILKAFLSPITLMTFLSSNQFLMLRVKKKFGYHLSYWLWCGLLTNQKKKKTLEIKPRREKKTNILTYTQIVDSKWKKVNQRKERL